MFEVTLIVLDIKEEDSRWYYNTRATVYVFGKKTNFASLDNTFKRTIKIINTYIHSIIGRDIINF